jgi:hypothetical protein
MENHFVLNIIDVGTLLFLLTFYFESLAPFVAIQYGLLHLQGLDVVDNSN